MGTWKPETETTWDTRTPLRLNWDFETIETSPLDYPSYVPCFYSGTNIRLCSGAGIQYKSCLPAKIWHTAKPSCPQRSNRATYVVQQLTCRGSPGERSSMLNLGQCRADIYTIPINLQFLLGFGRQLSVQINRFISVSRFEEICLLLLKFFSLMVLAQ